MGMPAYSVIIEPVSARSQLVQDLTALLHQSLRLGPTTPALTADEPLFGGRLPLDSVDSLQWATAIERQYRCELTADDLAKGALESLGQMADTLLSRGIVPIALEQEPNDSI
jgi:acyl carrier protein